VRKKPLLIEIEIPSTDQVQRFCPLCGIENFDKNGKINDCIHLRLIGTDEGIEFDKNNISHRYEASDLNSLKEALNDDYVCFTYFVPPPSGFSAYAIYKFVRD